MVHEKRKDPKNTIRIISAGVAVVLVAMSIFVLKILVTDDGGKRKRHVQMVRLLKPPPPPKIKEKPPEPEIKKKEEVIEPKPDEAKPDQQDDASDEPPPGDDLGLDAEGGSGMDGFGLRAKKGGRSLIGGGYGDRALMRRYAWYTRIMEEELRKKLNAHLEENGGIPDEDLKAVVRIALDDAGNVLDVELDGTCGNAQMDRAVKKSLKMARISEPPPSGMPRIVKLKISVKG